jgi:hypothetical protein
VRQKEGTFGSMQNETHARQHDWVVNPQKNPESCVFLQLCSAGRIGPGQGAEDDGLTGLTSWIS